VLQKGGKFNLSKPMSDVDWMVKNAKCQPGPQDYNADASYKVDPDHTPGHAAAWRPCDGAVPADRRRQVQPLEASVVARPGDSPGHAVARPRRVQLGAHVYRSSIGTDAVRSVSAVDSA